MNGNFGTKLIVKGAFLMKRVLIVAACLAGLLVFSVAAEVLASTAYLDYTVGGNAGTDVVSDDSCYGINGDLNEYLAGVEVPLGKFKVGLEYASDNF